MLQPKGCEEAFLLLFQWRLKVKQLGLCLLWLVQVLRPSQQELAEERWLPLRIPHLFLQTGAIL